MADPSDRGRGKARIWIAGAAFAVIAIAIAVFGFRTLQDQRARKQIGDAVRNIEHGDEVDRTTTILGIGAVVTNPEEFAQVFPHVIRAMKDESLMVRGAAVSVAGGLIARHCQKDRSTAELESRMGGICTQAEQTLLTLLDDPSPIIRVDAAKGLEQLAVARELDSPPPRLVASLDDAEESVRVAAIDATARYRLGTEAIVPAALRRIPTEGGPAGRAFTRIFWSVRIEPSTLPLLIEGLSNENAEVRLCCAAAINHMGPDAGPALPAILSLIRKELETPQPDGSPPPGGDILAMASGAIGEIWTDAEPPPGAVDLLCEVLKRPNDANPTSDPNRPNSAGLSAPGMDFRLAEAAWSLGILGRAASSSVPLLISTFEAAPAESTLFRGIAAEALAEIVRGTPDEDRVIATLAKAWKTAPPKQKAVLARAMRSLGPKSEQLVPELKQMPVDDTPSRIRRVRYYGSDREAPTRE